MAKTKIMGWIHEPLTAVLGTRGKLAALRVLWRAASAIPYREVVRRSGMAYRTIDLAVGELTETGVVDELPGGRERRVRLNTAHRLAPVIAMLMQVESDFFSALRIELRTVAEGCRRRGLVGAAIVGAAARRAEPLGAPLEIVALVTAPPDAERCTDAFVDAADAIASRFGVTLKVSCYDLPAARLMWRTRTPTAERNVRESELLAGESLVSLLEG